jgi:hypothetical protein
MLCLVVPHCAPAGHGERRRARSASPPRHATWAYSPMTRRRRGAHTRRGPGNAASLVSAVSTRGRPPLQTIQPSSASGALSSDVSAIAWVVSRGRGHCHSARLGDGIGEGLGVAVVLQVLAPYQANGLPTALVQAVEAPGVVAQDLLLARRSKVAARTEAADGEPLAVGVGDIRIE